MKRLLTIAAILGMSVMLLAAGTVVAAPADPDAKCKSQKLNASAIYAKKVFYCWAQAAMNTLATTPDEFLNSPPTTCIGPAATEFDTKWGDAGDCSAILDPAVVRGFVDVGVGDILTDLLAGEDEVVTADDLDPSLKENQKMLSAILKGAGQDVFTLLKGMSQYAMKANDSKLEKAACKADKNFGKKWQSAQKKWDKETGEQLSLIADSETLHGVVETAVEDLVDLVDLALPTPVCLK